MFLRKGFWFILCVLVAFTAQPARATAVKMVLQWEHQAQFAGFYMAQEMGFYAGEQLEVELISGGADVDPLKMVLAGEADFASAMLATALVRPEVGELTLITQLLNRSCMSLVAWKNGRNGDTRIETPTDLTGKIVTIWDGFQTPYLHFFKKYAIEPQLLPQYYTFSLFLNRGSDACSAMFYNEYHTLKQLGISDDELTVFNLYELGIDLPEDGIYCRREFYRQQPEVCASFSQATLRGWHYAKKHPEKTLDVVMRYVRESRLPINRQHMSWMLKTVLESIYPLNTTDWTPGKLSLTRIEAIRAMLQPAHAAGVGFVATEVSDE